jgi:hypothetical protein
MHLICLPPQRQLGPSLMYVKGTLVFTEFGSMFCELSLYQAILSVIKVVLIVDPHLHVSKWMHRRLPSQSWLYFLITGWWWLVACGTGLNGRPKECRSHLRHYESPTWTASYIVCSDGSQGCVQDWSNDFMHFLVTNYKCTFNKWWFTNTTIPAMCLVYLIFLGLFTASNIWRGLVIIKVLTMRFLLYASAFGPNAALFMFLHGIFPYSLVSLRNVKYLRQLYISPVFKILSLFCSFVTDCQYRYECFSYE